MKRVKIFIAVIAGPQGTSNAHVSLTRPTQIFDQFVPNLYSLQLRFILVCVGVIKLKGTFKCALYKIKNVNVNHWHCQRDAKINSELILEQRFCLSNQ